MLFSLPTLCVGCFPRKLIEKFRAFLNFDNCYAFKSLRTATKVRKRTQPSLQQKMDMNAAAEAGRVRVAIRK